MKNISATIDVDTRALRRALRTAPIEVRREIPEAMARAAAPVLATAQATAPRRSGRYATSLRLYPRPTGVALGSRLAYAPVLEFAKAPPTYASLSARWGPTARVIIPAIEHHRAQTIVAVERELDRVVDRVFV